MSTSRRSLRSRWGWVGTVIRVGFASDTAVRATGIYSAEVRPGWDIAGHANGGYLLAIVVRAMREATGRDGEPSFWAGSPPIRLLGGISASCCQRSRPVAAPTRSSTGPRD